MGLKDIIKGIKFKKIAHKQTVTPKGDCYIQYIINKYINETKPDDYIEAYEQLITRRESQVKEIRSFDKLYIEEDGTHNESMIHFLAATVALAMIFISIREIEVQKYLDLIKDEDAKRIIYLMSHPDKALKETK